MPRKILLNDSWQFHMGELDGGDTVKKIASKAGMCGGASNLTRKEGLVLEQPPIFTKITGKDDSFYGLIGISGRLTGNWSDVNLPNDWMFRQPYAASAVAVASTDVLECVIENPGYFTHGAAYYRKVFKRPQIAANERVLIEFEGVMHNCDIWLNGHYLGSHLCGYTSFSFDVTEYLGEKNALLVRCDSHGNEGWWYEGAGIYRDVWLLVQNEVSIEPDGLWARIDEVSEEIARGRLVAELQNLSDEDEEVSLELVISEPDVKILPDLSGKYRIEAFSKKSVAISFEIPRPLLWDIESPSLYKAMAVIYSGGEETDRAEITFGVRDIEYKRDGLYLNGKKTEIKGVCEHQDFAGVGTALTRDILEYKVKCFKKMGANALRSAHHPATKALLDVCDREGMLVLNENRHFSLNPEAIEGLRQLVRDSRNHPCVFMYCLENEEFLTGTQQGKALLKRMKKLVKHLDPTRGITMAGMIAKNDPDYVKIADVAGFNYDDGDAAKHLANMPELRVMATEDSSFCSTRGAYEDSKVSCSCTCYDDGPYNSDSMDAGTIGGAASPGMLEYAWNHYKHEVPELGGVFIWTGMDYRGESFPWYWPSVLSQFGAMDICGFPKDQYYYWQSCWLDASIVHVLPHWNWQGRENKTVKVETYSNCEETELFVNSESMGCKKTARGKIERWDVIYQPGELKAVGYNNGKAAAEIIRRTFGVVAEIRLEPLFRGGELVLVKVAAYDGDGILCETADTELRFSVTNGEIVGCGNGDPRSHEDDAVSARRLFNGLALVIVKPHGTNSVLTAVSAIGEASLAL